MLSALKENALLDQNEKLAKLFAKTQTLIEDLNQREIPTETQIALQDEIAKVNSPHSEVKAYKKTLKKAYNGIVRRVQKDMGLSPQGYHLGLWMSMGIAVFGVPLGLVFGVALGNIGLMSIGIPIGLGVGMAIGAGLDEKAKKEGKQLSV